MQNPFAKIREEKPFGELSDDQFAPLIKLGRTFTYSEGSLVCRSGDESKGAYILADGEVVEEWPDGIVTHQYPGTLLEGTALLSERNHEHTLRVPDAAQLIGLSRKRFYRLLDADEPIAQSILYEIAQNLVHQIRDLNRSVNELVQLGPSKPRG